MDKVVEAVDKVKRDWGETFVQVEGHIKSIEECGKGGRSVDDINSLPRLSRLAQDGLSLLSFLLFQLDLLAPQLPSYTEVESAQSLLESWKNQLQSLRGKWKRANLQAKENMRKAAQKERELLLGGGEESTIRRRNLQAKAGMTTAAESITDSLRRTRQLMVQEVERNANALMTVDESTTILRKAESEYKGHRSLLMRTRNLLSTMQRQDVLDRVILILGFLLFSCVVLYVVSKRMGLLKLQRTVTAAIKVGMARKPEVVLQDIETAINHVPAFENRVGNLDVLVIFGFLSPCERRRRTVRAHEIFMPRVWTVRAQEENRANARDFYATGRGCAIA
ncbi:unnamed protein product [Rhodiola kirilowii]